MIDIRSLLKRGSQTSAELRKALTALDHDAAARELAEAEQSRKTLLLDGSDAEILKAEQRIDAARINVDRLRAADEELTTRIASAELAEAAATLSAERDRAERDAADTAKALAAYGKHAGEIVKLLDRLTAAEEAVRLVNAKLIEAGREGERLAAVEQRAFPIPENSYPAPFSIAVLTSLRPTQGQPGFGAGAEALRLAGINP